MKELEWLTVPAGTRSSPCRGTDCNKRIYFVERPRKGKPGTARIPVDCDVDGGSSPDAMNDGRGVNHFQNCGNADQF